MTVRTIEGNEAVGESALACSPDVVAAYPITPATRIVELLAEKHADGVLKTFVTAESEFSAISILVGASATGARTFTATSSQGLLLMHEVLHNASGNRLPIVMAVGNRAVSAPLSIWSDAQDTFAQRDTGWLQFYARSNQEAVDLIPIAFRVAESIRVPAMVSFEAFYLTHCVEQLDVRTADEINQFLPPYKPDVVLDPLKPVTLGAYTTPPYYEAFRRDLADDLPKALSAFEAAGKDFKKLFGREYTALESFHAEDSDFVIVGEGAMMTNAMTAIEELREAGESVGVLNVRVYRPFPAEDIRKALAGKTVAVMEKALSLGGTPPLYVEIVEALLGTDTKVSSFVGGLGGREVGRKEVRSVYERLKTKNAAAPIKEWI